MKSVLRHSLYQTDALCTHRVVKAKYRCCGWSQHFGNATATVRGLRNTECRAVPDNVRETAAAATTSGQPSGESRMPSNKLVPKTRLRKLQGKSANRTASFKKPAHTPHSTLPPPEKHVHPEPKLPPSGISPLQETLPTFTSQHILQTQGSQMRGDQGGSNVVSMISGGLITGDSGCTAAVDGAGRAGTGGAAAVGTAPRTNTATISTSHSNSTTSDSHAVSRSSGVSSTTTTRTRRATPTARTTSPTTNSTSTRTSRATATVLTTSTATTPTIGSAASIQPNSTAPITGPAPVAAAAGYTTTCTNDAGSTNTTTYTTTFTTANHNNSASSVSSSSNSSPASNAPPVSSLISSGRQQQSGALLESTPCETAEQVAWRERLASLSHWTHVDVLLSRTEASPSLGLLLPELLIHLPQVVPITSDMAFQPGTRTRSSSSSSNASTHRMTAETSDEVQQWKRVAKDVARAVEARGRQLQQHWMNAPEQAVEVIQAAAALKLQGTQLPLTALRCLAELDGSRPCRPLYLAAAMPSCAELGLKPPAELTERLIQDLLPSLPMLPGSNVAEILGALRTWDHSPPQDWGEVAIARIQEDTLTLHQRHISTSISAAARLDLQPPEELLEALLHRSCHLLPTSSREEIRDLLAALADMDYLPGSNWCDACLRKVEALLVDVRDCNVLVDDVYALGLLAVKAPGRWCTSVVKKFLATPGHTGENITKMFWALQALVGSPRTWVSENLGLLERLVLMLSTRLRECGPLQLMQVVVGCANLGFHPGRKFMGWHESACIKHMGKFPAQLLFEVRAAYLALGFRPESRLREMLDSARNKVMAARNKKPLPSQVRVAKQQARLAFREALGRVRRQERKF